MSGEGRRTARSAAALRANLPKPPTSRRAMQRAATRHAAKGRAARAASTAAIGVQRDATNGLSRHDYAERAAVAALYDRMDAAGDFGPPSTSPAPAPRGFKQRVMSAFNKPPKGKKRTGKGRGAGFKLPW
ncbi:MAG: hypothetical protein AAF431_11280 [Pseudomonadota bacterium]